MHVIFEIVKDAILVLCEPCAAFDFFLMRDGFADLYIGRAFFAPVPSRSLDLRPFPLGPPLGCFFLCFLDIGEPLLIAVFVEDLKPGA